MLSRHPWDSRCSSFTDLVLYCQCQKPHHTRRHKSRPRQRDVSRESEIVRARPACRDCPHQPPQITPTSRALALSQNLHTRAPRRLDQPTTETVPRELKREAGVALLPASAPSSACAHLSLSQALSHKLSSESQNLHARPPKARPTHLQAARASELTNHAPNTPTPK